jgi:hypothetical protein
VTRGHEPGPVHRYYAEDHCALSWRLPAAGLCAPLAAIALFVVTLATPLSRAWVAPLLIFCTVAGVWVVFDQMLPYAWPVGIRLDAEGIGIGGLRWAERHPGTTRRPGRPGRLRPRVAAAHQPGPGPLSVNWSSPGYHQPVWVVPTRRPAELEAALSTMALRTGMVSDPYPDPDTDVTVLECSAP